MSTAADLVTAIKKELKSAQMTYAELGRALGMAESSVKRMLARGNMSLSRIDAICQVLKLDFSDLVHRAADAQPLLAQLSHNQETAVVSNKKLLLVTICVLSLWTLEQISERYRLSEAECIGYFAQLDRIGIIEMRPLNRYHLKLAKTFRWQAHGPVMRFFRENAVLDYFSGGFDGSGEGLVLVHGAINRSQAPSFLERLQRVAQDFTQQQLADQKGTPADQDSYTLLLAIRNWELGVFTHLRR
jgi:transcriptional regulator with XRE-family HTH domain